ncbi:hypothetical protein HN873_027241, partial [Arachis hypogaea]
KYKRKAKRYWDVFYKLPKDKSPRVPGMRHHFGCKGGATARSSDSECSQTHHVHSYHGLQGHLIQTCWGYMHQSQVYFGRSFSFCLRLMIRNLLVDVFLHL